jgi:hypothetical protein
VCSIFVLWIAADLVGTGYGNIGAKIYELQAIASVVSRVWHKLNLALKSGIIVNYAAPNSCDSRCSLCKVSGCEHFDNFYKLNLFCSSLSETRYIRVTAFHAYLEYMHLSKDVSFLAESNVVKRGSTPRPCPLISGILCFLKQNPQLLGLRSNNVLCCTGRW